jgi:arylsulfatase A-like enzyme
MNGIFLAYGQAIQPGVVVKNAQIVDLAPTILHLMGEPVPGRMDGVPLDEILRGPVHRAHRSAQSDAWNGRSGSDNGGLSDEEKQALTDRFRSLGYVG